ncbi:MAG: cobyrinate a,c-diamide synthase [Fretibacterium sp.]|nr:cobyrinate a,c-diamide synthase [Fretibacterium sp.]
MSRKTGRIPRLLIAAAGSGSGKTTLTGGFLAALSRRGFCVCSYKIGPDYIDSGHQRRAGHCEVYNLDTWMMDRETMTGLFAWTAQDADIAVVEGVMGLYDGGRNGISSSAEIAKLLRLPVVLVIDARSMGESAAAVALGFREYDRSLDLRGVILNRVGSDSHRDIIAQALSRVGIPLLGALKRDETLALPERHLGLTPVEEAEDAGRVERVRIAVEAGIDIDALLAIARSVPPLEIPAFRFNTGTTEMELRIASLHETAASCSVIPVGHSQPNQAAAPLSGPHRLTRLAVARDEAFSFYYPESLAVLAAQGAELIFFSPLRDTALPLSDGLILGGGFPEMFAAALEANVSMRGDIAAKIKSGLPVLAECGGLMYLSRSLTDFEGRTFEMVGSVPASCQMNKRLQRVGYVEVKALRDTAICPKGTVLRGHEFHFSSLTKAPAEDFPDAFLFKRTRTGETYPGGYARGNVLASYLHLNLLGFPAAAEYFLKNCAAFALSGL